jgi:hypothetical protein
MIKVTVEVHSGAARTGVAVTAESIERAICLVAGRFPGRRCRVKFPIEPEGFFARGYAREVITERPEKLAA